MLRLMHKFVWEKEDQIGPNLPLLRPAEAKRENILLKCC